MSTTSIVLVGIVATLQVPESDDSRVERANPAAAIDSETDQIDASEFAIRILATIDLLLKHYIDPPPRQAMLTEAVRSLFRKAGQATPLGLGRRVSEYATEEQIFRFLSDSWIEAHAASPASDEQLQTAAIQGMLNLLPEKPSMVLTKEAKVQEQIRGNRYVGIGIQVGMKQEEEVEVPVIISPFPRPPPARVAGARAGDVILEIDGVSTKGMTLEAVVDRLRGEEGSSLTMIVRSDRGDGPRTLDMTRGVVPFQSFAGYSRLSEDEWQYRPTQSEPIGYLQLTGIRASTLTELRSLAPTLESDGIQALVLDLRFAGANESNDIQHVVLLADELLEEGRIGSLTDTFGATRTYQAGPDCLFREWPIVILINGYTAGLSEFLAAALQDNQRVVTIGERTNGSAYLHSSFELPDGIGSVRHWRSAVLSRADGRRLNRDMEVKQEADDAIGAAVRRPPKVVRMTTPDATDWGVQPDHEVARSRDQFRQWLTWRQQQQLTDPPKPRAGTPPADPQLAKALEILRAALRANTPE